MATKKTIPVIAALNEVAWYNKEKDSISSLSVKARWNLKKNMAALEPLATRFNEFRDEEQKKLLDAYMTEEKSEETTITAEDGTEQMGRRVKDEYREEFDAKAQEINMKLQELLMETEEVTIYPIDMDAEIEHMDMDAELSDEAMDMLSLFMEEEEVEGDE